jgi:amidase
VGDPDDIVSASTPAAVAGYPILSVPIGRVGALPVGLAIYGTAWSEPMLLRVAASIERAVGTCPAPEYEHSV